MGMCLKQYSTNSSSKMKLKANTEKKVELRRPGDRKVLIKADELFSFEE